MGHGVMNADEYRVMEYVTPSMNAESRSGTHYIECRVTKWVTPMMPAGKRNGSRI